MNLLNMLPYCRASSQAGHVNIGRPILKGGEDRCLGLTGTADCPKEAASVERVEESLNLGTEKWRMMGRAGRLRA